MKKTTLYSIMMIILNIACSKDEPDITTFGNYNLAISLPDIVFSSLGDEKELTVTATKEKFTNGTATGEIVPVGNGELVFSGLSHFKYEMKQEVGNAVMYKIVATESTSAIQETLRISIKDSKETYKEIPLSQHQPATYGDYRIEIAVPDCKIPYTGEKKEIAIFCKREKTLDGKKEYVAYPMTGITIKSLLSISAVTIIGVEGTYKATLDTPRNELSREIEQSVSFYSGENLLGTMNILQDKNPSGKTGHIVTLESVIVWED